MNIPMTLKENPELYKAVKDGVYNWIKIMIDNGELKLQKDDVVGFDTIEEFRDSVLFYIEEEYINNRRIEKEEFLKELKGNLDLLTSKEQKIISMRLGFDNGIEYNLREVGQKFGVTRERIRQIEAKALEKIRNHILEKR